MSISGLKETTQYKEAVQATAEIGQGFSEPNSTQPPITTVAKQINTLLYSVISLRVEIAALRRELAEKNQVSDRDISQIVQQLDRTHLSSQGEKFKQDKGKIKVYRNPFEVLKQIQEDKKSS